ncbi:response regulator [Emticicia fluvialis]|uniref:response regulator n=1 Tax=Emticicia fluvialis TaxID=2974474 RepID=UPI002165154C|nr:response regulator [Emticicia fluvialis]
MISCFRYINQCFALALTGVILLGLSSFAFAQPFKSGELDLRKADFSHNNNHIDLSGEWGFYWNKLLPPGQATNTRPDYYIPQTTIWNNLKQLGEPFKAFGYATYTLKIYIDHKKNPQISFFIPAAYSSYKIWINCQELSENGVVGTSKETYSPYWLPVKKMYMVQSDTLHLVMQVANFDHYRGGFSQPIILGSNQFMEDLWITELSIVLILTGILLMVSLIFFGLYFLGQRDPVVIYFALYCLVYIYRLIGVDKIYYINQAIPGIDFRITFFLEYFTIFFCIYLFARFLKALYPRKNVVIDVVEFICIVYIISLVVSPVYFITYISQGFFFIILFFVSYNLYKALQAFIHKKKGSVFAMLSMSSLGLAVALNILGYFGYIQPSSYYLFFGYFGFIFFQALILSYRFVYSFRKAREEAEQGAKAKSEFLANMSHEIRTPLNGVIGFTDLLMKTKLDNTQQQYMSTVFQSANTLLDIINDILDFSKIEAGKLEIVAVKTDIHELLTQVTDIITFQASQKSLEVLLNIPANAPRYIWVDVVRLKQILVNLLSNAVKFTETGEIELKLEVLGDVKHNLNTFRFTVKDTGIGIAPQNQERIFHAFSQEDSSTTRKFGGTGLGLTISNKLLALMYSELKVESELNRGTTFYFDLKLKSEEGESDEWENLDLFKRVLIADDNKTNRTLLKSMLDLREISYEEAVNGQEVLEMLERGKKFDLLIIDYHMPFLDGLDTVRILRHEPKYHARKLPVMLIYSSNNHEYINSESEKLHIRKRLVKPVIMQRVFEAMSNIARKSIEEVQKSETPNPLQYIDDRTLTILVVEDNKVNMLFARTIFKSVFPYGRILEAENGKLAVEIFKTENPDIIFMDMQMPEMNGLEATQVIREMETPEKRVPIIALTAGTVKGEKEKCLDAGMDDYITKPFIKDTVVRVIQKYLGGE